MDTRMKTIGLIGGMSWESTTLYYQIINREVAKRLGGLRSAKLNLVSLDFADIAQRQRAGDWDGMALILIRRIASRLFQQNLFRSPAHSLARLCLMERAIRISGIDFLQISQVLSALLKGRKV